MRIFSDFDGTYSDHPELAGITDAIVTGRSWEESQDLYDELGDSDLVVFFNPVSTTKNDASKIVLHKAEIINRCGVGKFFEDVPQEAAQLKILCPSTKIVLVRDGVTAI
jgi:2-hydroxy-3-keto-5-methylthiopentenyl-1-phosphate phosphatase